MFNWALYELALKIYDHIQDSKLKPLQRWKSRHSKKQLAEFSAYYAKRMQVSILENLNGSGIVALYDIYLTDYCHTNPITCCSNVIMNSTPYVNPATQNDGNIDTVLPHLRHLYRLILIRPENVNVITSLV